MSSELRISQRTVGPVTIVTLSGALIHDEPALQLRQAVTAAMDAGALAILLDLEPLSRMDSCGVGALVATFRHVTRRGGQLKLLRPNATVRRVLGLAHMTFVFDIFDDEHEALLNLREE
jgi:anti-sigma B factor antagonist